MSDDDKALTYLYLDMMNPEARRNATRPVFFPLRISAGIDDWPELTSSTNCT